MILHQCANNNDNKMFCCKVTARDKQTGHFWPIFALFLMPDPKIKRYYDSTQAY